MGDGDGDDALGDDLSVLPDGGDEGGHAHSVGRLHERRGERHNDIEHKSTRNLVRVEQ